MSSARPVQKGPYARLHLHLLVLSLAVLLLRLTASAAPFSINLLSDAEIDSCYGTAEAYGICTNYATSRGLGQRGCESPMQLVTVMAQDAATMGSNATLFVGGMLRRDLPANLTVKEALLPTTLALSMWNTQQKSARTPGFIAAIGPTDTPQFDYAASEQPDLSAAAAVLEMRQLLLESEKSTFTKCGYYVRDASDTLRIVVLNTVIYSRDLQPAVAEDVEDPCGQLAFLREQLEGAASASKKVILMGNIPPTVNVTGIVERGQLADEATDLLWIPRFQKAYLTLVSAHAETVALQVFGHTYRFSLVADPAMGSPLITLASVTPLMGNTPSYMIAELNETSGLVTGLMQRRMQSNFHMSEVEVNAALGLESTWDDVAGIQEELQLLGSSDTVWGQFVNLTTGGVGPEGTDEAAAADCDTEWCRRVTVCSLTNIRYKAVETCLMAEEGGKNETKPNQLFFSHMRGDFFTDEVSPCFSFFSSCYASVHQKCSIPGDQRREMRMGGNVGHSSAMQALQTLSPMSFVDLLWHVLFLLNHTVRVPNRMMNTATIRHGVCIISIRPEPEENILLPTSVKVEGCTDYLCLPLHLPFPPPPFHQTHTYQTLFKCFGFYLSLFSLIGDIDLDPAFGTPNAYGTCTSYKSTSLLGDTGCESPITLAFSVSSDCSLQKSSYTMFTGAWSRHKAQEVGITVDDVFFPLSLSLNTIGTTGSIAPPTLAAAVGGTDFRPSYHFDYAASEQPDLSAAAAVLEMRQLLLESEKSTFTKCGYYVRDASDTLRIVVLNTVIYSRDLQPAVAEDVEDPCGQLAFLREQLEGAASASKKVILMGNIPPTVNVTGIVERGQLADEATDLLWIPRFQKAYLTLVSAHAETVALQVFGHTYRFSLVADPAMGSPLITLASVTPLMGNTPSYMIAELNNTRWSLKSIIQRHVSTSAIWSSTDTLESLLGFSTYDNLTALQKDIAAWLTSDKHWNAYTSRRRGADTHCTTTFCRAATVCAMEHIDIKNIQTCVTDALTPKPTTTPPIPRSSSF
eukprot:gene5599-4022_t